jgi:hypothetical protein
MLSHFIGAIVMVFLALALPGLILRMTRRTSP